MIKHGYLGFFSSITELENKFPAAKFPGNSASINVFGETLHYVSSGTSWNPVNAFTSTEVAAVQSLVSGDWNSNQSDVLAAGGGLVVADDAGNLTGPGGAISAGASSAIAKSQISVCLLGNSVVAAAGPMMSHLNKISGGLYVMTKNGGVAGYGSASVLSTIATQIDPAADVVIYMEGSNDASSTIACSTHYNNMRAIAQYCADHGQQFVILASPPRDVAGTTTNKYTMKYPLVDWLVAYDLGGIYCDPWRANTGR